MPADDPNELDHGPEVMNGRQLPHHGRRHHEGDAELRHFREELTLGAGLSADYEDLIEG
jgi:hypothetical protein